MSLKNDSTTTFIGEHIGNYRITARLTAGGFGVIYLGEHTFLTNRHVAVKILHDKYVYSERERSQFLQEAQILNRVRHPYVLPVIDVGTHRGFPYIMTDYQSRGTLEDRLRNHHPLTTETIEAILRRIGLALVHVHAMGVVHCDIKPANILFDAKDQALLMDFGIAEIQPSTSQQRKTIQGSFDYMAPEQWQGMICRESDQYALGCLAYRLYTGHLPFQAQSYHDLQHMHLYEAPLQPRWYNPAIPEYVEAAILTAMAKESDQRHESVLAFLRALRIAAPSAEKRAQFPKSKAQWLSEGYARYRAQQYQDALAAFNQALQLDAEHALAYYWKGLALFHLNHLERALAAFDEAIRCEPRYPMAYNERGNVLYRLERYGEAVAAYTMAIHLNPHYALAYRNKGVALDALRMPRKALLMRQRARELEGGQHKDTNGTDAIKPHQPLQSFRV